MVDTLWADVSQWQVPVDDRYPYQVLAIRADDGTYRDIEFPVDYGWAHAALDSGKLKGLIVYCVYRQNWSDTLVTFKSMVGTPHPRMAVMMDVESWGGQIAGDQSGGINALHDGLAIWLNDPRRVIGYGNTGDLNALWPHKPAGIRLIVAAYGSNPAYPGKIGHQFADNYNTPPFGPCDINSADGMDVDTFCAALGLDGSPSPIPPPAPAPPAPGPGPDSIPFVEYGQSNPTIAHLQAFTNQVFQAYSHLPVTGFYGDATTQVVKEFQRRVGIIGGDGRNVGVQTRAKFYEHGFRG